MFGCRKIFSQFRKTIMRKYEEFRARRTSPAVGPTVVLVKDVKELVRYFQGDSEAGQIVSPTTGEQEDSQRPISISSSLESHYSDADLNFDTELAGPSTVTDPEDDFQEIIESSTDSQYDLTPRIGHSWPCPKCKYNAANILDQNRHYMAAHQEQYQCPYCDDLFPFRFYLISHWKTKHAELPRPLLKKGSAQ